MEDSSAVLRQAQERLQSQLDADRSIASAITLAATALTRSEAQTLPVPEQQQQQQQQQDQIASLKAELAQCKSSGASSLPSAPAAPPQQADDEGAQRRIAELERQVQNLAAAKRKLEIKVASSTVEVDRIQAEKVYIGKELATANDLIKSVRRDNMALAYQLRGLGGSPAKK